VQLAFVKLEFNEVEAATKLAEQAIREQPNDAQTHAILADCYGQKADAAGLFKGLSLARDFRKEADAALALDPMNYEALHSYMLFYLEAPGIAGGSKSKAEEMADRIARVNPAKGMLARAEIAMHENHLDQLLGLYQKAAQADPSSYEAAAGLAAYYINFPKWRDVSKAEEYAQRAIKLDPARTRLRNRGLRQGMERAMDRPGPDSCHRGKGGARQLRILLLCRPSAAHYRER